MNKKMRKFCSLLLAVALVISSATGLGPKTTARAAQDVVNTEGQQVTVVPVTVKNEIGDVVCQQTKVNETNVTLKIENVNDILAQGRADTVRVTARMYYNSTVTQEVTETFPLEKDTREYPMDFKNFGKFQVRVEYLNGNESVSVSDETAVGVVAEAYNFAPISATFPAVLFSLSLWEGSEYCITVDEEGDPVPTIAVFERADSWDWSSLPENVYKLPTASESDFSGVSWGGQKWLDAREKMSAYIRDLYEISPNAHFNLYYTDNFVENVLTLLVANQIPEDQYNAILLSDGSGTYAYFNNTYSGDDAADLYADMRADWEALKEKTRQEKKFDPSWAKYNSASNLALTCLPKYAAVAAEDENIDWWVARTNGTFKCSDEELLAKVVANCTVKGVSAMLKTVQEAGKDEEFKKLYHFDGDMFDEATKTGKPVMLILGSTVGSNEPNFNEYTKMVMNYYGDSYVYYYKGHPGTPTNLHPEKQEQLDELNVTDVDSSIPAELILFFFPDIYMCGYDSSTFQSVESEQMACGMFNKSKAAGLEKTYGEMLDFFATPVNTENEIYGSLCTEQGHDYYLLEFNDTENFDIAVYDATADKFAFYKNTAQTGYQWSTDVMANMTVEEIPAQDYTGEKLEPTVTVKSGDSVLEAGVDYTVTYGENKIPGQGSVIIEGKGDYAAYGTVKKYFVINKIDNPLSVTVGNVVYGTPVQPQIVDNPSGGKVTYVYKQKGAADEEYSIEVPTELGEYTLQATSAYTDCYNSATVTVDFAIIEHPEETVAPTAEPSGKPVKTPAVSSSAAPTDVPAVSPTGAPTNPPVETASAVPTKAPGTSPSGAPTKAPGASPSAAPTGTPAAAVKAGQKITSGKFNYTVTAGGDEESLSLKLTGTAKKKMKTVSIPKKVTYKGVSYPVTEIGASAFAKNKSLTKVTIGSSVKKIGKKAFMKCSKLSKVTIQSKKISKIGSKAFAGISKKAKFKLPSGKKKDYRKKITKSGFKL